MLTLLWILGSFEFATTTPLSQYNVSGLSISGTPSRSVKNLRSQTTSFATSQAAMYSTFIAESTIQDCLMLLQTMAPPPKVNTDLDVGLRESLSD